MVKQHRHNLVCQFLQDTVVTMMKMLMMKLRTTTTTTSNNEIIRSTSRVGSSPRRSFNNRKSRSNDKKDNICFSSCYWSYVRGGLVNRKSIRLIGFFLCIVHSYMLIRLFSKYHSGQSSLSTAFRNSIEEELSTFLPVAITTAESVIGQKGNRNINHDKEGQDYDDVILKGRKGISDTEVESQRKEAVVYFDNDVLKNIQATYDGARSYLEWPQTTTTKAKTTNVVSKSSVARKEESYDEVDRDEEIEGDGESVSEEEDNVVVVDDVKKKNEQMDDQGRLLPHELLDKTFQVLPLMATVDRRPIIVRKQIIEDQNNNINKRSSAYNNIQHLGCAISSTTFVSDLAMQDVKSRNPYENYPHRCQICFQFSNLEDMHNFGGRTTTKESSSSSNNDIVVHTDESVATKCFQGVSATLSESNNAEWQQKDERFVGYGYPWTVDCQMPNGIPELTCEAISNLQKSMIAYQDDNNHDDDGGRDDIQSISYHTRYSLDGWFNLDMDNENTKKRGQYVKRKFDIHSRWPWKAVMSHDDHRSKIAKGLQSPSAFVPRNVEEFKLAHVVGPIYDANSSSTSIKSTALNPESRGGIHFRFLTTLFHLIRNAPGTTHMIAVVDGQVKQTQRNLMKLLQTPIHILYPKYSSILATPLYMDDELIPISKMTVTTESYKTNLIRNRNSHNDTTLMDVLRHRKIHINIVPIMTPNMAFQKSVCGVQYLFTTYLAARYAADYHAMMYIDGDVALIESSKKTLNQMLFDRFFDIDKSSHCAGHRIRMLEQFVEPKYDDDTSKVLQCTAGLATNHTKWDYALHKCQLKEGHIVARTDSIYAFNVHHPETLSEYTPDGVDDCIARGGHGNFDRYYLKEKEMVELHLRNRQRKSGCSCFYEPKNLVTSTSALNKSTIFDDDDDHKYRIGDYVTYFYDYHWGWLLAEIIDIQRMKGKATLRFLTDSEVEIVDYNSWRVMDIKSMNVKNTGAFRNCTATGSRPKIDLLPHVRTNAKNTNATKTKEKASSRATVSCHRIRYKASKDAFRRSGKIIIGILSGAKNYDRREAIRKTWAENRTGVFFIVAGPWNAIEGEYEKYQDLLWINELEAFELLTLKTALFIQVVDDMASELNLGYSHVLKTDDDSYVALDRYEEYFGGEQLAHSEIDYWGYCEERYWQPIREPDHSYYVSYDEYPKPLYAPYCQGAGFLLSRKFVHCAGSNGHIEQLPFLSMEDAFVGMLAARCNIRPTHDNRVQPYRVKDMKASESRTIAADSPVLTTASMDGKFLQHQIKGISDMIAHHTSVTDENHPVIFDDGIEDGNIVVYYKKESATWMLAEVVGRKRNGEIRLSTHTRIGDIVVYFYDGIDGWLLATVIDIKRDGKLQLMFHLDDKVETVEFDSDRFSKFESMNAYETGAFANCTASDTGILDDDVIKTNATVSCRTMGYVASKDAFKRSGKIITGVLSNAVNYERRQLIRSTWASNRTGVFFIVAGPWGDIAEEYNMYQDLVWIDKEEAFSLLTLKTSLFIQVVDDMALELNLEYSHILKTDDDSYVALGRLEDYIRRRQAAGNAINYWGQCRPKYVKPIRDSNHTYNVEFREYPESYYPPYCQGAGFVLSRLFVHCAGSQGHIKRARYLSMEDVFVGLLAARCGIWPTSDRNTLIKVYRVEGATVFNRRVPTGSWLPNATMDGKILQHQIGDDKDMLNHHSSVINQLKGKTNKRRLELVHITKTGGSALEKAAANHGVLWGTCHYLDLEEVGCTNPDIPYEDPGFQSYELSSPWHTPPRFLPGYSPYYGADLFAVVRNPYSRAVSEYYCPWLGFNAKNSKVRKPGDRNDPKVMNAWIRDMVTKMQSYVVTYKKEKNRMAATPANPDPKLWAQKHYINQAEYVYSGGKKVIQNVLYYENLDVEFSFLMDRYDLKQIRLPPKARNGTNIAQDKKLSYLDLWPETIQIINEYAKADFRLFGYEMVDEFKDGGVAYSLKPKKTGGRDY